MDCTLQMQIVQTEQRKHSGQFDNTQQMLQRGETLYRNKLQITENTSKYWKVLFQYALKATVVYNLTNVRVKALSNKCLISHWDKPNQNFCYSFCQYSDNNQRAELDQLQVWPDYQDSSMHSPI